MSDPDGLALRSAIESMLDPYVILRAVRDDSGAIVDFVYAEANQLAADFNQLSRDELIGTRLLALHPAAAQTGLLDGYRAIVDTGEALVLDD
jgi:PAS domain-containing protein